MAVGFLPNQKPSLTVRTSEDGRWIPSVSSHLAGTAITFRCDISLLILSGKSSVFLAALQVERENDIATIVSDMGTGIIVNNSKFHDQL